MEVKIKGYLKPIWVTEKSCQKRECFAPGRFEHRGSTMKGSRNTGEFTYTCMTNAYHGCPRKYSSGENHRITARRPREF